MTELDARNQKSDGEAVSRFIEWESALRRTALGKENGGSWDLHPEELIGTWTLLDEDSFELADGGGAAAGLVSAPPPRGRKLRAPAPATDLSPRPPYEAPPRAARRRASPRGRQHSVASATSSSHSCSHRPRPAAAAARAPPKPSPLMRSSPSIRSCSARAARSQSRAPIASASAGRCSQGPRTSTRASFSSLFRPSGSEAARCGATRPYRRTASAYFGSLGERARARGQWRARARAGP